MRPLHYAADRGHLEVVQLLLDHDADINAVDDSNQTALMFAAICDHAQLFKYLLDRGADHRIANSDDETVHQFRDNSAEVSRYLALSLEV
jgi:ankyrin repeat protein